MTTALAARNIDLVPGGDYYLRSFDPSGAFFRRQFYGSTATPVVTLTSVADQMPALNTTYTAVFTSDIPCSWRLACWPSDDAVLTVSANLLVATVTWAIPATARKTSEYVGVFAETLGGQALVIDRVHVGATSVRWIGLGQPYATLAAAITGAPAGSRFVVKNGTYTSSNMFVNGTTGAIPNGVFSTYTAGGSTRYTVTEMTTYMAETPLDVILDGGGGAIPINISGNHPYEQECLDYDTAAGTTQFTTAPFGAISRVGLAIKGFHIIGSTGPLVQAFYARYVHVQYCYGVMNAADDFAFYLARGGDYLVELSFATGRMRGVTQFFKQLRFVERRCGSTMQNTNGSQPVEMHGSYESRDGEIWNCFDIDGKDAWQWNTGASIKAGSFVFPESDFHNDEYYPDFSENINAGRLIGVNNYMATLDGEAWEHDPTAGAYTFTDIISWDNTVYESGYDIISGGPFGVTGLTIGRINNQTGDSWFFRDFRPPQRLSNGLFVAMGWNGLTAVDQGDVWHGRNDLLPNSIINNFIVTNTVGRINNPSFTITLTNQQTTSNIKTDGFLNLTRIQPGSRLDTLNIGVKDAYKIHGKLGTFWGDTGYQAEVDRDWTESFNFEKVAGLVRAYSYTGATQTKGTQTLSGNRGWARSDTNFREYLDKYVIKGTTAPVHYPYAFNVFAIAGDVVIFLRQYYTAIKEHKVYIDGIHAETIPTGYHCAQIKPLRTGKTYSITVTCVDDNDQESVPARAVSVTL